MKFFVILTTACTLIFLSMGVASADEVSDLKQQVEALQKEVEEIKEQPSAYSIVSESLGKQTTVNGHFKFFLADQSQGDVSTAILSDESQSSSFSAGISDLWLYFNKQIADWVQISVAPQLHVEASATPALGSSISRSGSSSTDVEIDWAYLNLRLPWWELELKAGAFYPYFSEDYASKIWWDEQYNGNTGLLTLEAWKSAGLELYRNFDFDNFSLPVYLYYLNGEDRGFNQDKRFTDNNSAKSAMVHVAPEFFAFGSRIRLLGSVGIGSWDDDGDKDSTQMAGGADVTRGSLRFMGEYMYRGREGLPLTGGGTEDGEDKGWYIKGIYTFGPKWRIVLKYSDVDLWFPSTDSLLTDNYKTTYGSVNYFVTESSIIIPEISYVDANRSGSPDKTQYLRYTLGWRTTF